MNFPAFPGVLNWQKKLWNIVSELRNIRETLDQSKIDELRNTQEFKNSEHSLWQTRNFLISDITFNFNYTNQLSVGITRMWTLTSRLKVLKHFFSTIKHVYFDCVRNCVISEI